VKEIGRNISCAYSNAAVSAPGGLLSYRLLEQTVATAPDSLHQGSRKP
jgi:hypothetical protein